MFQQDHERSSRLAREKAVFRYTTAFEEGNIATIADVWQQAAHDASLEQMLLETHAAYQYESPAPTVSDDERTTGALPTLSSAPLQEQATLLDDRYPAQRKRRAGTWLSSLAAVLIAGILVSSFLVLFASRHTGMGGSIENLSKGTWHVVTSPNETSHDTLFNVAALTANDVWAVGASNTASGPSMPSDAIYPFGARTLIEHWDGSQWRIVPSPNSGTGGSELYGVAVISSNDAWAVGNSMTGSNTVPGIQIPLIEHWNGTQWSVIAGPSSDNNTILSSVTAITSNNVWAVGTVYSKDGLASGFMHTLVEHWDGHQWQIIPSPNVQQFNELNSVTAIASNNIWAVGDTLSSGKNNKASSLFSSSLIEHWDGTRWSVIPTPGSKTGSSLDSVTAVSANDVWAVGVQQLRSINSRLPALVEHWDGKQWRTVSMPNPAKGNTTFLSVKAISADNVWIAGWNEIDTTAKDGRVIPLQWQLVIEHWNGKQWQVVDSRSLSNAYIQNMTWVPGTHRLWAVGHTTGNVQKPATLIATYSF